MPSTVNGIGTWYYGKANVVTHEGTCQSCHRLVRLSSYDTREWIVVLFVPIIPLRQKRVMNACPACRQHLQMPLKKYLKQKNEEYDAAYEKVNAAPQDADAAIELLGVLTGYQDMEALEEAIGQIEQAFSQNAKVQGAIGSIYYQCGPMEKAQSYFERSLALEDDDDVREALGYIALRMSDPDTAAAYFQFILEKRDDQRGGTLMALVEGYQATGRHSEALELLDKIAELIPEAADDKGFKKARKLSQKHQASGKAIKSKGFTASGIKPDVAPSSGKTWAIAAAVIIGILLLYVSVAFYRGMNANVFLVNGLTKSYEVALNDKTYTLPEYGYLKVGVAEGDVTMSAPGLGIADEQFSLASSFWSRPFSKRIYVVNPDKVAPVMWTRVFYAENPSAAPDAEWNLHMGQSFYVFNEVDFPFKEFPDEISLSSSSSVESRDRVSMLAESEVPRESLPEVIEEHLGREMLVGYLQKNLYYEPDNIAYLNGLTMSVEPDQLVDILRPGLDAKPVRVNWHRYYQNTMEKMEPEHDLAAEYKRRIDQSPDDPVLQYLMGRAINDDNEASMAWLSKSVSGPNPCSYGYSAIGYYQCANAQFDSALVMYQKAVELEPDNDIFKVAYHDMLTATGATDQALAFCRAQRKAGDEQYTWVRNEMMHLTDLGMEEQAGNVFTQWYQRNQQICTEDVLAALQEANRRECAYVKGDFQEYLKVVGEPNEFGDQIILTLNLRNTAPVDFLVNPDFLSPMGLFLFYVSETRLGNHDKAKIFMDEGIAQLQKEGYAERVMCECLQNGKVDDAEAICQLAMDAPLKAVLLTAMGVRCPEHQAQFFELAEKLNYRKEFPYHFLRSVHAEPAKTAETANSSG